MPKETENPFSIATMTLIEKDSLRAQVCVKVHDLVFLTGIRIIEGKAGPFVAMPSRRTVQGEYQDIFFPASRATRDQLSQVVLDAYQVQVGKAAQVPA